jgi:hypothetical protein
MIKVVITPSFDCHKKKASGGSKKTLPLPLQLHNITRYTSLVSIANQVVHIFASYEINFL